MNQEHFVVESELRTYRYARHSLEILVTPDVFPPSNHALFYLDYIEVRQGETVIDIGTGTGLLGIAAAKARGVVCATDVSERAVMLAKANAQRNGVSLDCRVGSYFGDFEKFDVILANLPQEILPPEYERHLGELSRSISGGNDGNKCILEVLGLASEHMHKDSRFYLMVYGLTDYRATLQKITSGYKTQLLAMKSTSTKKFVADNLGFFRNLQHKVALHMEGSQICSDVYVLELRLK